MRLGARRSEPDIVKPNLPIPSPLVFKWHAVRRATLIMAKFDLTSRMAQYLDRHLVFPLLEFLSAKQIYEENELLQGKLDILSKTNMVDYAIDIRKQLYPKQEVPETLKNRRVQVLSQLQELQNEVAPILKLLSDDVAMKTMETLRDSKALLNFLTKEHDTMCPHILRYLATAVIINRSRRSALKDLVKVIQQESYTYRDPITEFLEHLYVNFDFDGARENSCNYAISSYIMLAEKLNMNPEEAECWIVNLIRNARLDAKIDSKLAHVVMGTQPLSPYQQLVEKIDSLSVRSEALQSLIERKLKARTQDIRWGAQEF
uniref:Eukaryotic translation initiation factor 3 subunit E N-terminal domain-containing protein n=3 Tax=Timema TaxID=61471 RepID=A0A7R9CIK0_TIMPO|nr:unnamed protein product [Timema poppensis]